MNKITKLLAGIALCVFLFVWYAAITKNHPDNFSCEGFGILYHGDISILTSYKVLVKDGTGSFTLNGVTSAHHNDYPLSRQVYFSYVTQGGLYLMKSIEVTKSGFDHGSESGAENHYPAFFSEGNRSLTLKIARDGKNNRIFFIGGVPFLYCSRL